MKNTKNSERFTAYARETTQDLNVFIVSGFMFLGISYICRLIYGPNVGMGFGLVGLLAGYYGVVLSIFALSNRTFKSKMSVSLLIPVIIAVCAFLLNPQVMQ